MRKYSIAIGSYAPVGYPAIYKTSDILENIQKAHDLGYAGIEWHLREPNPVDIVQVAKVCNALNMPVTSIGTGMAYAYDGLSLMHPEPDVRTQAVRRLKKFIDMGADLGSTIIIGSMKGRVPVDGDAAAYKAYLKGNLQMVIAYAERKRVTVVLEVLNRYESNLLNTAAQMDAFIKGIGSDLLKTHLDTFHMNIEEFDIGDSIRNCSTLGHMHYADSNRRYPGAGHIDFVQIEQALKDRGYEGVVGVECLPCPEPDTAAKKTIEHLGHVKSCTERMNKSELGVPY